MSEASPGEEALVTIPDAAERKRGVRTCQSQLVHLPVGVSFQDLVSRMCPNDMSILYCLIISLPEVIR